MNHEFGFKKIFLKVIAYGIFPGSRTVFQLRWQIPAFQIKYTVTYIIMSFFPDFITSPFQKSGQIGNSPADYKIVAAINIFDPDLLCFYIVQH